MLTVDLDQDIYRSLSLVNDSQPCSTIHS